MIVTGSLSVVRALMAQDLITEYRLLTFPTAGAARVMRRRAAGATRVYVSA